MTINCFPEQMFWFDQKKFQPSKQSGTTAQVNDMVHVIRVFKHCRYSLPSTSTSVTEKDANKKDICTSLMAENCQGKKCDKHHTRLPYLWQVRIFGSWVSFNDLENQNIEKSYCSLSEIQDAEVC